MELTLKRLLEQAEFSKSRKGYDQDEVDEFLDRAVAMATKVEARLNQALNQQQAPSPSEPAPSGPSPEEIEAEVERRVEARMAQVGPSEEETAEEVRRTIVLAQRTADAAVREARHAAAKKLAEATEQAEQLRQQTSEEVERERTAGRQRVMAEIRELEGVREALRSDVTVLERHVEEQRDQLRSAVAELSRLLEDPSGFRMAPTPALLDPTVPDDEPAADDTAASGGSSTDDSGPEGRAADADGAGEQPSAGSDAAVGAEVDHDEPGTSEPVDPGPPTAQVSATELGITPGGEGRDPYLDALRSAVQDDRPLGPRRPGDDDGGVSGDLDDERRSWPFGKRR